MEGALGDRWREQRAKRNVVDCDDDEIRTRALTDQSLNLAP